jgi:hypothetical protein
MEKFIFKGLLAFLLILPPLNSAFSWGFFAHKNINKLAVFTLPSEMIGFYKKNLDFIVETAVLPDKRRYAVKEEGARHYIDMDFYQDSLGLDLPLSWNQIDTIVSEEFRLKHGVLPWHLNLMRLRLTEAFRVKDPNAILKLSSEIGHYIGDASVPLHTCSNYNGQLTNQHGIHGLWESRVPEIYFNQYEFWVGQAEYIDKPQELFWKIVFQSHAAVDSVLSFEKKLSEQFSPDQKYSFEQRGGTMTKVYSRAYCKAYHDQLNGQVERRMKLAVKTIGNIWYTCWVDAGQPDLSELINNSKIKEEEKEKETIVSEEHKDCVH